VTKAISDGDFFTNPNICQAVDKGRCGGPRRARHGLLISRWASTAMKEIWVAMV